MSTAMIPTGGTVGTISGTAAALAASNPVGRVGALLIATDTDILAIGDGATAWNSLPKYETGGTRILDSSASTTVVAPTGPGLSTVADISGLAQLDFDVVVRPVVVELTVPWVSVSAGNIGVGAQITDAANTIKGVGTGFVGTTTITASSVIIAIRSREIITTPGTYARKGRLLRFAGTATFGHGFDATTPIQFTATEL